MGCVGLAEDEFTTRLLERDLECIVARIRTEALRDAADPTRVARGNSFFTELMREGRGRRLPPIAVEQDPGQHLAPPKE
jgi:hypothetical protein